jgi:hypothetical protein
MNSQLRGQEPCSVADITTGAGGLKVDGGCDRCLFDVFCPIGLEKGIASFHLGPVVLRDKALLVARKAKRFGLELSSDQLLLGEEDGGKVSEVTVVLH